MASVALKNLCKKFGDTTVVNNVNVEIADGEFLVFVGPSGCGKTTTLRMVVGLESVSGGEIHIGNSLVNDLPPGDRDVAMVFQNYALYSHMTVSRNLGFALQARGVADREILHRVQRVAKMLDLEEMLERKPRQLSGGQRQRVALGRAVIRNPKVFLMDEPLSNLDALLRLQTRKELIELTSDLKSTVIYVTHDQVEAMTMGHRLAVMNKGEVAQLDTPEKVFNEPANRFVAEFIGSPPMNFLKGQVLEESEKKILKTDSFDLVLSESMNLISGSSVIMGFRPHDVTLVSEGGLGGRVTVVETLGAEKLIYLQVGKNSLSILVPATEKIRSGDHLQFEINKDYLHLFNNDDEKRIIFSGPN